MEAILNDIKRLTTDKPQGWYCCQGCSHTYQAAELQTACPSCHQNVYQWSGDIFEEAISRANRAKGVTNVQPAATPEPSPSTESAATAAPAPVQARKPRSVKKTEEKPPEQPKAQAEATSEQKAEEKRNEARKKDVFGKLRGV